MGKKNKKPLLVFEKTFIKEIGRHEKTLYECAVAVEKDVALHKEMNDWSITLEDGLSDEL